MAFQGNLGLRWPDRQTFREKGTACDSQTGLIVCFAEANEVFYVQNDCIIVLV